MTAHWTRAFTPRALPRRRVPARCANPLGHYWLIGAILANTARKSVRHPHLMGFFDRHPRRPGMVWYACKECGWADCVTEDRLPAPGRIGRCQECGEVLEYRLNRNGLQVRCGACARRHRSEKMAAYRREWKRRHPAMVKAQTRRKRARRKAEREREAA